eukprot:8231276-Lingulodinium_polyedra.AAC.1
MVLQWDRGKLQLRYVYNSASIATVELVTQACNMALLGAGLAQRTFIARFAQWYCAGSSNSANF